MSEVFVDRYISFSNEGASQQANSLLKDLSIPLIEKRQDELENSKDIEILALMHMKLTTRNFNLLLQKLPYIRFFNILKNYREECVEFYISKLGDILEPYCVKLSQILMKYSSSSKLHAFFLKRLIETENYSENLILVLLGELDFLTTMNAEKKILNKLYDEAAKILTNIEVIASDTVRQELELRA